MPRSGFNTIKGLSTQILRRFGRQIDNLEGLRSRWAVLVGEPTAAHSEPTYYETGRLTITTHSPAWASRLRQQEAVLIAAIRADSQFNALRELRIRIQPTEPAVGPAIASAPAPRPSRISNKAARIVLGVAETVADPQLRAALERLGNIGDDKKNK